MKNTQTTEIVLTEDEVIEIVRKHFNQEGLLNCHGKRTDGGSSMYYNEKEDEYRFEFSSKETSTKE